MASATTPTGHAKQDEGQRAHLSTKLQSKAEQLAEDAGFRCAVCMEPYAWPVTTSCGHTFCKYCLAIVLMQETQKRQKHRPTSEKGLESAGPRCPMCRDSLKGELVENDKLHDIMVQKKAYGAKSKLFRSKCCIAYDRDPDKELCHSSGFQLVLEEDGTLLCDIAWASKLKEHCVTRLNGSWDQKTGSFEARAYTTTWQNNVNSAWSRYKPQHAKGCFPSMGIGKSDNKAVPYELWTGTFSISSKSEKDDTKAPRFTLTGGRFEPKDTQGRESPGVVLIQVQEMTGEQAKNGGKEDVEAFGKEYAAYVKANAPEKEQGSFLSSFLAAPKPVNNSQRSKGGGLAFANLWAHSSPDTSGFQGTTV